MIKSAEDVIKIAENRGFKVLVNPGPPPMPFLRDVSFHGNGKAKQLATAALLDCLRAWRLEVIELVQRNGETE